MRNNDRTGDGRTQRPTLSTSVRRQRPQLWILPVALLLIRAHPAGGAAGPAGAGEKWAAENADNDDVVIMGGIRLEVSRSPHRIGATPGALVLAPGSKWQDAWTLLTWLS